MRTNTDPLTDPLYEALTVQLREIILWVQEKDQSKAVQLDSVVHQIEIQAHGAGAAKLVEVMAERDAAWADLQRIKQIVLNPLQIVRGIGADDEQAQRDAELAERMTSQAPAEQP